MDFICEREEKPWVDSCNDFKKSYCEIVALFKYEIAYLDGSIILKKSLLFYKRGTFRSCGLGK